METLELLERAFARLGPNGENWTQGALARNSGGKSCGFTLGAGAVKWCSVGILFAETKYASEPIEILRSCIPLREPLAEWNDGHSWHEIRLLWEAAIEKAKLLKTRGFN